MPTAKRLSKDFAGKPRVRQQLPRNPTTATNRRWMLAVLLAACTLGLYYPVVHYPFVNYDDNDYVTANSHVQQGLTKATFIWAIRSTEYSNWHPVTWISHALDWELFGKNSGGHHFTNVFLHAVNAALIFLLLAFATGKTARSLFVAAVFAFHPLNVESVAWIAERKSVLSMFLMLLALAAYGWYIQQPKFWRYVAVFVLFALGLAAKPMIVTLPFLLLLLDYWPLQRFAPQTPGAQEFVIPQRTWQALLLEKIPLLLLSAASSVITVIAQHGSIPSSAALPLGIRFANALHSYAMYLRKAFWPSPLVVYYPLETSGIATWETMLALLVLAGLTAAVWKLRARRYLLMGWLWFLGTLVPMIGLVQVGNQAMADRYAYLPLIGIFVAVTWMFSEFALKRRLSPRICIALAGIVLVSLSLVTLRQIRFWNGSLALWTHTLEVTKHNLVAERNLYVAEDNLAYELLSIGRADEALAHFQNAARLAPADPLSHWALAASLKDQGHLEDAMQNYEIVTENPENPRQLAAAYLNMAVISTELGNYSQAGKYSAKALQTDQGTVDALVLDAEHSASEQGSADAYLHLGLLLELAGQISGAQQAYQEVIKLDPASIVGRRLLDHLESARTGSVRPRL
jgi:protein O-mannosyl-transferase